MLNNKILLSFSLFICLFSSNIWANCEFGERVIKLSHVSGESHPKGILANAISNRINSELNGKVCMEVYPKSKLFNDNRVFEGLLLGDVQFAIPSLSKFEAYTKKFRIFDLPFLFDNGDSIKRFLSGQIGRNLLLEMEDKGISGVGFLNGGLKQFSANKPLFSPDDAKGLTFRANSSDVTVSMFEALGSKGVKLPFKEAYQALRSGVADGQENSWSNILSGKFHEVQDGVTQTDHRPLTYMVITSTFWINSLPQDIRNSVLNIFNQELENVNDRITAKEIDAKEKLKNMGVSIRYLSDEQRNEWKRVLKKVWDRYSKDIGDELISEAIKSNTVN